MSTWSRPGSPPLNLEVAVIGRPGSGRHSLISAAEVTRLPVEREHGTTRITVGSAIDRRTELVLSRVDSLSGHSHSLVIACFSIGNPASYTSLPTILGDDHSPRILVGCQCDLRDRPNIQVVSSRDGLRLMAAIGARAYVECSSKKAINISELYHLCGNVSEISIDLPSVILATGKYSDVKHGAFGHDQAPVFCEFCRLLGPGLRRTLPGASEPRVMQALAAMFEAAPAEMKVEIKRSLLPAKFFRPQEVLVRYRPA
jgi:hypothetical protein